MEKVVNEIIYKKLHFITERFKIVSIRVGEFLGRVSCF
jgi:hypothetical protein